MSEPSFDALLEQASAAQPASMSGDVDLTPVVVAVLRWLFGALSQSTSMGEAQAQGMLAALISEGEQR